MEKIRYMLLNGNETNVAAARNEYSVNKYSLDELVGLSIAGLGGMFDADRQLFRYKYAKTGGKFVKDIKEEQSVRYTIISLLGLKRLADHTGEQPVDIIGTTRRLVDNAASLVSVGDLGLLFWLCAHVAKDEFERLYEKSDIARAIERYQDGRSGLTTELSWLLTGLTYFKQKSGSSLPYMEETIMNLYGIIKGNYYGNGIFGHQRTNNSILGRRGQIGCFADQVYPIYAFSIFGKAFGNREALEIARATADCICEHQGPLGQWWWHYDASTGKVVGRYPVYSVHQDGMAPMALYAASNATGRDYSAEINKGLPWIMGRNELGIDMVDIEHNAIWRNIHRPRIAKYTEITKAVLSSATAKGQPKDLSVLFESWSYHLGWLLYAFADKIDAMVLKKL